MNKTKLALARVLVALGVLGNIPAFAEWSLDNSASSLSFVTIKAANVAEVHSFKELSGSVSADGRANITIQLASVDTLIPIRDERMRAALFETGIFPTASLAATLDVAAVEALAPGGSMKTTVDFVLNLHGRDLALRADLLSVRLSESRILVMSLQPVIVNATSVDLVDGIEKLRELASLPSISQAVPVSFVLSFAAH